MVEIDISRFEAVIKDRLSRCSLCSIDPSSCQSINRKARDDVGFNASIVFYKKFDKETSKVELKNFVSCLEVHLFTTVVKKLICCSLCDYNERLKIHGHRTANNSRRMGWETNWKNWKPIQTKWEVDQFCEKMNLGLLVLAKSEYLCAVWLHCQACVYVGIMDVKTWTNTDILRWPMVYT